VSTSVFYVRDFSIFVSGGAAFVSQTGIRDFTHSSGLSSDRTSAVEQLQIRRRPARTLTEIAIENTATDRKC
jgi:hypothetical protein